MDGNHCVVSSVQSVVLGVAQEHQEVSSSFLVVAVSSHAPAAKAVGEDSLTGRADGEGSGVPGTFFHVDLAVSDNFSVLDQECGGAADEAFNHFGECPCNGVGGRSLEQLLVVLQSFLGLGQSEDGSAVAVLQVVAGIGIGQDVNADVGPDNGVSILVAARAATEGVAVEVAASVGQSLRSLQQFLPGGGNCNASLSQNVLTVVQASLIEARGDQPALAVQLVHAGPGVTGQGVQIFPVSDVGIQVFQPLVVDVLGDSLVTDLNDVGFAVHQHLGNLCVSIFQGGRDQLDVDIGICSLILVDDGLDGCGTLGASQRFDHGNGDLLFFLSAAACEQGCQHCDCQQDCQEFFHVVFLLVFLGLCVWVCA